MQRGTQRAFAPDCIRAAALVLVLTVHFFLHSGFYHKPLQGVGMMLSSVIRMACLPRTPVCFLAGGCLLADVHASLCVGYAALSPPDRRRTDSRPGINSSES